MLLSSTNPDNRKTALQGANYISDCLHADKFNKELGNSSNDLQRNFAYKGGDFQVLYFSTLKTRSKVPYIFTGKPGISQAFRARLYCSAFFKASLNY